MNFYIDADAIMNDARQLHQSANELRMQAQRLKAIKEDFSSSWSGTPSYFMVKLMFDITIRKLEKEADETEKLAIALERIAHEYMKAESTILGNMQTPGSGSSNQSSGSGSGSGSDETGDAVFDKYPNYGGDQTYGLELSEMDETSEEFQEVNY